MIVICVEGCHGCGKTAICEEFSEADFWVLDEGFMDMPAYALHPQSLLMETTWVCQWFTRLLKKMSENKAAGGGVPGMEQVFIADRSPFSACFYSRRAGELLDPVIREQIKEVREAAGIEVYTVYVKVEKEVLWSRIQSRLENEPERKKYDEDKREWMEKTLDFYDNFNWDMVVDNTDVELPHLMQQILKNLAARSPQLRTILNHKDSPGKFYFRKRLGSTNVLLDSDDMEDGDTKKSQESAIRATSSAAGAQANFATPSAPKSRSAPSLGMEDDEFGPAPFPMDDTKTREPSP